MCDAFGLSFGRAAIFEPPGRAAPASAGPPGTHGRAVGRGVSPPARFWKASRRGAYPRVTRAKHGCTEKLEPGGGPASVGSRVALDRDLRRLTGGLRNDRVAVVLGRDPLDVGGDVVGANEE